MKKRNKAAIVDWHDGVREAERQAESLSQQQIALFYASNKRDSYNWPSPEALRTLGYPEVAALVSQAYGLLAEAEYAFNKQHKPELYNREQ